MIERLFAFGESTGGALMDVQYYNVPNQAMLQIMLQHFCRYGGR